MDIKEYVRLALATESDDFELIAKRMIGVSAPVSEMEESKLRLLHAFIGITTEIGEAFDALKKHLFYGKGLDWVNLAEELGDLSWYMAVATDVINAEAGQDWEEIMERNIAKLKSRYPDKFKSRDALNRDLDEERKILESHRR